MRPRRSHRSGDGAGRPRPKAPGAKSGRRALSRRSALARSSRPQGFLQQQGGFDMTLFGALRLPSTVVFGRGQRAALGMMAARLGRRALICTDARLAAEADFTAMVGTVEKAGLAVQVFDGTEGDLPITAIAR